MERQFEFHLEKLRSRIIKMSSLVEEQLEFALKSFDEENPQLAELVREREENVNKLDRKIEKTCQKIIALSQPVAMDLRLVISALTINTNLERVGDLAENIARNYLKIEKKPDFIDQTKYYDMAKIVQQMIKEAIDSFNNNDPKLAREVIEFDNQLDDLFAENREIIINLMKSDPTKIDEALCVLEISRHMERIGDHATNIAEDVYFIVEAQLIKHKYEKFIYSEMNEEENDTE
jgi:phosphate transport system protein